MPTEKESGAESNEKGEEKRGKWEKEANMRGTNGKREEKERKAMGNSKREEWGGRGKEKAEKKQWGIRGKKVRSNLTLGGRDAQPNANSCRKHSAKDAGRRKTKRCERRRRRSRFS
ncbi:hypothetical protein niasHT_009073 [Heterodera trifolii]|uniref:Uncharacterized protein n=1 Tax=Heterodera trifolii TaxID=157864 RepID=A0ABD2MCV9_9BILA